MKLVSCCMVVLALVLIGSASAQTIPAQPSSPVPAVAALSVPGVPAISGPGMNPCQATLPEPAPQQALSALFGPTAPALSPIQEPQPAWASCTFVQCRNKCSSACHAAGCTSECLDEITCECDCVCP